MSGQDRSSNYLRIGAAGTPLRVVNPTTHPLPGLRPLPPNKPVDLMQFVHSLNAIVESCTTGQAAGAVYLQAADRLSAAMADPANHRQIQTIQVVVADLRRRAEECALPEMEPVQSEFSEIFNDGNQLPSEMDGVVDDMEAANYAEDGTPLMDSAEIHARYGQLRADRETSLVKKVRITPWSTKEPLMGQAVLVQYGGGGATSGGSSYTGGVLSGPVQPKSEDGVFWWDSDDEKESMVVTASFAIANSGANATYPNATVPLGTASYRNYGRIDFSSGRGSSATVKFDIGPGVQVTLAASHIYGYVGMRQPPTGQVPGSMYLQGSIGFFASATRSTSVTYTDFIDALTSAGSMTFVRPAFATSIAAFDRDLVASQWTLQARDVAGNVVEARTITANSYTGTPWPLSVDVYDVVVTNGGGLGNARLKWGLSL